MFITFKISDKDCIVLTLSRKDRFVVFFTDKDGKFKFNLIDENKNLLCDTWYDKMNDFENGYAVVSLGGKYNYINYDGKLLLNEFVAHAKSFEFGIAIVTKNNGKDNIISTNGKYLLGDDFDGIEDFDSNKLSIVIKNGKYNLLDTKGNLVLDEWYYTLSQSRDKSDIYYVTRRKTTDKFEENLFDAKSKKFVSDLWFDIILGNSYKGIFTVVKNIDGTEKRNFISLSKGNLLSDVWFDKTSYFVYDRASVVVNGEPKIIDTNGNFVFIQ